MHMAMPKIKGGKYTAHAPEWAILQRQLFDVMNKSLDIILEDYLHPNGYFKWPPVVNMNSGYGAVDDAYESFHAWPLFYVLGGAKRFLELGHRHFDLVNEQFSALPYGRNGRMVVEDDYYSYCDWMHQGEGNELFYGLCLADPTNEKLRAQAQKFAGYNLQESDRADNFDPVHQVFYSPSHGSAGPTQRAGDPLPKNPPSFGYASWMDYYGLPFYDVPGVKTLDDLRDSEKARAMGEAVSSRISSSDSVSNLLGTGLMMNAYLLTGDEKYKKWILDYAAAWRARTAENGGIIPDNAGPSGKVGELMLGKWYGGHYGWIWPHGYIFIAEAVAVAAENETLLTGDTGRMKWMTELHRLVLDRGIQVGDTLHIPYKYTDDNMIIEYEPVDCYSRDDIFIENDEAGFPGIFYGFREAKEATRPDRVSTNEKFTRKKQVDGWYEFAPVRVHPIAHAYNVTREAEELKLIERGRNNEVLAHSPFLPPFFKNAGGQEYAWIDYLTGKFDDFPVQMLKYGLALVYSRLNCMHTDTQDPMTYDDAYIQNRNPICTEALVQLMLGGPLPLYNGGLLMVTLFYFDADEKRPGIPEDVAALISKNEGDCVEVTLHNMHPSRARRIIIQGGAFGEHQFTGAVCEEENIKLSLNDNRFELELLPCSKITLTLGMKRYANQPKYYTA